VEEIYKSYLSNITLIKKKEKIEIMFSNYDFYKENMFIKKITKKIYKMTSHVSNRTSLLLIMKS